MTDFRTWLDAAPEPTEADLRALEAEGDDLFDDIITDVLDHEDTVSLDTLADDDSFYEDDYDI